MRAVGEVPIDVLQELSKPLARTSFLSSARHTTELLAVAASQLHNSYLRRCGKPHDPDEIRRIQVDLPAGLGKTATMIRLIQGIHEGDLPYSIVMSIERIDELEKVYNELLQLGVPSSKIERVHSGVIGSLNLDNLCKVQFLLLTQARLNTVHYLEKFFTYTDSHGTGYRDLFVWDESLLTAMTFASTAKAALQNIGGSAQLANQDWFWGPFLRGIVNAIQEHEGSLFSKPKTLPFDTNVFDEKKQMVGSTFHHVIEVTERPTDLNSFILYAGNLFHGVTESYEKLLQIYRDHQESRFTATKTRSLVKNGRSRRVQSLIRRFLSVS